MLQALSSRISCNSQMENDVHISLFKQEGFLKEILEKCKKGQEKIVIDALNELRHSLLMSLDGHGFIQIGNSLIYIKLVLNLLLH